MQNMGTFDGGMIETPMLENQGALFCNQGITTRMTDAAIANTGAFLQSELEKRDTRVREPLMSFTYPRDIPIKVGGGWVDTISSMNVDYGVSGGSGDSLVHADGSNSVALVQANFGKDKFRCHAFSIGLRIMFVDMQRANYIGRSLDQLLTQGVRKAYDKHMDANAYIGMERYGTAGLLNNPKVTASNAAGTGTGNKTEWKNKTPQQILDDVNGAILAVWEGAEFDQSALPNHILLPYAQLNYISTTKVTELAEKTILNFLIENNVAKANGGNIVFGATNYCKGVGVGGKDRMVVYVNNDQFIAMEELVPMSRAMTGPSVQNACYDSLYIANISEVELFYLQTIRYIDGI